MPAESDEHIDWQGEQGSIQPWYKVGISRPWKALRKMLAGNSDQAQKCDEAAVDMITSEDRIEDPENQTTLCKSCRTFERTLRIPKVFTEIPDGHQKSSILASGISIEAKECSLCAFFRGLRCMQTNVEGRHEEAGNLYDICIHWGMLHYENNESITFSMAPHDSIPISSSYHFARQKCFGSFFSSPTASPVRQPAASINYSRVTEWLASCLTEERHEKKCRVGHMPSLPLFQVIDCQSRTVVPWPTDTRPRYLALSYVWGKGTQDCIITQGNLPSTLPLVIEDSITVTLNLGYQYLWIDRYCIPQWDAGAKAIQISNMNHVYRHSVMTIIAAYGKDPSYGLPGVSKQPRAIYPSVTVKGIDFVPILLSGPEELERSVWNTRGWTYQEGLLSCRSLVFTESQAYFQCRYMCCMESIDLPHPWNTWWKPEAFRLKNISSGAEMEFFPTLSAFSYREVSVEADALNAFKGILEEYGGSEIFEGTLQGPRYFYFGIPLFVPDYAYMIPRSSFSNFLCNLTWRIHPPSSKELINTGENLRLAAKLVRRRESLPSWSYTGWDIKRPLYYDTTTSPRFPLKYHARMQVKRGDSARIYDSATHKERIMELHLRGEISPLLYLTGWVFNISIRIQELENLRTDTRGGPFYIQKAAPSKEELELTSGLWVRSYSVGELTQAYFICQKLGYPLSEEHGVVEFELLVLITVREAMEAMVIARRCFRSPYEKVGTIKIQLNSRNDHFWDRKLGRPGPSFPSHAWQTICLQ